jgi:hypothetical protein
MAVSGSETKLLALPLDWDAHEREATDQLQA